MMSMLYFMPGTYEYVAIAIMLTLLYSLPLWPFRFAKQFRKLGFVKTTLLAFTWAYVTTILPAVPVITGETSAVITLLIARFFFMGMLCVIFDMRDVKIDKMHALRSLATDVSRNVLRTIMIIAFLFYMGAGVMVRYHFNENVQLVAFFVTGLVVWSVYQASLKKQGYIFYYFAVDGLMLFSAAATFIASFF